MALTPQLVSEITATATTVNDIDWVLVDQGSQHFKASASSVRLWSLSGSNLSYSVGNVAIGTASSVSLLTLVKSYDSTGGSPTFADSALTVLGANTGVNDASLRFAIDNVNLVAAIQAQQRTTGDRFPLILNPGGGPVSVGTFAPTDKFEVTGDGIGDAAIRIRQTASDAESALRLSNAVKRFDLVTGVDTNFRGFAIRDATSAANRIFITSLGDVGIGTDTPGAALSVANLDVYADDAAAGAGGLTTDDIYRTATGEIRIKL